MGVILIIIIVICSSIIDIIVIIIGDYDVVHVDVNDTNIYKLSPIKKEGHYPWQFIGHYK